MINIQLYTKSGAYIALVQVPTCTPWPEVIMFRGSAFVPQSGIYNSTYFVEAVTVAAMEPR